MRLIPSIMVFGFALLLGCSKDQRAVKKIDGRWEILTISGIEIPENQRYTYTFYHCKLKQDEYCDVRTQSANGTISNFQYRVINKGTQLEFVSPNPQNQPVIWEIRKLNSTELKTRRNTDSTSIEYVFRKLD